MGVSVDTSDAIGMLSDLEDAIADNKARAMRYGAKLMDRDQQAAFATKAAPGTGRRWPKRSRAAWWPLMIKSGRLMGLVKSGYGIKTRNKKPKLFGKLGSDDKDDLIKAGALNWGRRKGGKPMPVRQIFGISRSSRRKFRAYYERQIQKAVD